MVKTSTDVGACPSAQPSDPAATLGAQYNSGKKCQFTFPVTPGRRYTVTTNHYVWFYSPTDTGSSVPPDASSCPQGTWYDPEFWSTDYRQMQQYPHGRDSIFSPVYASPPFVSVKPRTGDDDQAASPSSCVPQSVTVAVAGQQTPAFLFAQTSADFVAISTTPAAADFFQTQEGDFQANLGNLQTVAHLYTASDGSNQTATETLGWCLLDSPGLCAAAPSGAATPPAEKPNGAITNSGNNPTFTANDPLPISRLGDGTTMGDRTVPTTQFVCVQEFWTEGNQGTLAENNYACSTLNFYQLVIEDNGQSVNSFPFNTTGEEDAYLSTQSVVNAPAIQLVNSLNTTGTVSWSSLIDNDNLMFISATPAPPPTDSGTSNYVVNVTSRNIPGTPTLTFTATVAIPAGQTKVLNLARELTVEAPQAEPLGRAVKQSPQRKQR